MDLYLDHDVSRLIVPPCQSRGWSTLTSRAAGKEDAEDYEQLLFATNQRRVIVSHNAGDFRLLHGAWQLWCATWQLPHQHAGIIILPHGQPAGIVDMLDQLAALDLDLTNELYEWWRSTGWTRRP